MTPANGFFPTFFDIFGRFSERIQQQENREKHRKFSDFCGFSLIKLEGFESPWGY
jgi:hypothetical protein